MNNVLGFRRFNGFFLSKISLLVVVLAVFSAGCKVRVIVPAGGTVVSESGSYSCAEDTVCEIDVADIFFDEVFLAIPKKGYSFVAWQTVQGGFCGRSPGPCALSTDFLGELPELMAILASDDVFQLRPYFAEQSPSGGLQTGTMAMCLDKSMYQKGYTSDITRQLYDDDGSKRGRSRTESRVTGPTKYNGQPVMALTEFVTNSGPLPSTLELVSYSKVNLAKQRVTTVAIEQESITPARQIAQATLSPGFLQRLDLAVGQTYTTSYTLEAKSPSGEYPAQRSDISTTITFEGLEKITIPAGMFMACRLHRFDTVDGNISESYNWIGKGNGLLLREAENNFVTAAEIVSASVAGKPI